MKKIFLVLGIALAAVGAVSIMAQTRGTNEKSPFRQFCEMTGLIKSETVSSTTKPAAETPEPPQTGGEAYTNGGCNDLAYNMNALMTREKNYMISPMSIQTALMLAANGTGDETRAEMLKALGVDDIDAFNAETKRIIAEYEKNKNVDVSLANSIWLNTDHAGKVDFGSVYKKTVENFYGAKAEKVNNSNAVDTINNWCSDHTNGKIKAVLSDPDFVGCLVNAIYFKGDWAEPFEKEDTYKQEFTERGGKKKETDFMHKNGDMRYYEDENIKIAELPYKGGDFAMYAVLDNDKRTDIRPYLDKLAWETVNFAMPKFRIEYEETLNEKLYALGIKRAFDPSSSQMEAMFENAAPGQGFYISKVLHKTYIDVEETGTEAAAVTAVLVDTNCAAPGFEDVKEFIADKPFSFVIYDKVHDRIMFMGEYAYTE